MELKTIFIPDRKINPLLQHAHALYHKYLVPAKKIADADSMPINLPHTKVAIEEIIPAKPAQKSFKTPFRRGGLTWDPHTFKQCLDAELLEYLRSVGKEIIGLSCYQILATKFQGTYSVEISSTVSKFFHEQQNPQTGRKEHGKYRHCRGYLAIVREKTKDEARIVIHTGWPGDGAAPIPEVSVYGAIEVAEVSTIVHEILEALLASGK